MISYIPGTSRVQAMDDVVTLGMKFSTSLKDNLILSQNRNKQKVNQHRFKCSFQVWDRLFLRLQPHKQSSLNTYLHQKLTPISMDPTLFYNALDRSHIIFLFQMTPIFILSSMSLALKKWLHQIKKYILIYQNWIRKDLYGFNHLQYWLLGNYYCEGTPSRNF